MNSPSNPEAEIIAKARAVLKTEADGIAGLVERVDHNFAAMVDLICQSEGRLIIGGIGKSGIIGRKIVATLNSTGTRSLFLHPVEAMHGDLGQVSRNDIFIGLSNSGQTDELNILLPSIRRLGCKIIAFTANKNSALAKHSDIVIDVGVKAEAGPMGLVPTASTTALLAMGDALAVVLLGKKQFKSTDFRLYHPGGLLGQRLACRVNDLMLTGKSLPLVAARTPMSDAVKAIDEGGLGTVLVVDGQTRLVGIITDGDIRRMVAARQPIDGLNAGDIMTANPRSVPGNSPTYDALNVMEQHQITVLPVIDSHQRVQGILHLHDILGKGEFKFNGK